MIAPISDARIEEALAILDRLGPAESAAEHSEPVASAATAVPASEPATVAENPAATPGAAFAASAPSGSSLGLEAVMAVAAATSNLVKRSLTQSCSFTTLPPAKNARNGWTDAEDAVILEHVAQYGAQEWARCAEAVGGGRTFGAVSTRWHGILKKIDRGRAALANAPDVQRQGGWTDAEDAALLRTRCSA